MTKINKINDYVKFTPFLVIYFIICLVKVQDTLIGDEDDYLLYANNLINGFYANPSHEYSFLWNGPGYPMFLSIFVYFKIPLLIPKMFNVVFMYLGLVFFFKTISEFIPRKKASFVAILLGLYYPFLVESIPFLLTESLSYFLISSCFYNIFLYIKNNSSINKWLAILSLGYLILTKIFFGYVLITLIILILPFTLYNKTHKYSKKFSVIMSLAFCLTIPYLVYTYSLTNKLLYFGNSGGMSLYWMSTPFENEFGDWYSFETIEEKPELFKNHSTFINSIKGLPPIEKDIALKEKAIENILNNKLKFFKNWQSNLGRLFFNYPYFQDKPSNSKLFVFLPKGILVALLITTFFLSIKYIKELHPLIYLIGLFVVVYIAGISLLSSYPRFLHIILPIILIWISYTLNKFVILKLK